MKISDQLRRAIADSGESDRAIATRAGLAPSIVTKFTAGKRAITSDSLDKLAETLGYQLAIVARPAARPRRRK